MSRKPKFRPEIRRIKLNPEQAVLLCNCYDSGVTIFLSMEHSGYDWRHTSTPGYCGGTSRQWKEFTIGGVGTARSFLDSVSS